METVMETYKGYSVEVSDNGYTIYSDENTIVDKGENLANCFTAYGVAIQFIKRELLGHFAFYLNEKGKAVIKTVSDSCDTLTDEQKERVFNRLCERALRVHESTGVLVPSIVFVPSIMTGKKDNESITLSPDCFTLARL